MEKLERTEAPKERGLGDIKQEYAKLASDVGQCEYQIRIFQAQALEMYKRMQQLNQEASKLAPAKETN